MGWKLHLFHAALLLACTCAAGNNDCEIFSQRMQTECSPGNFVESQDQSELGSNGYLSSLFKLCLWVNGQGWLRVMIPFELFSNERSKQQTTDSWSPNVIYSIQFYLVLCCPAPPHPIQSTVFFLLSILLRYVYCLFLLLECWSIPLQKYLSLGWSVVSLQFSGLADCSWPGLGWIPPDTASYSTSRNISHRLWSKHLFEEGA